MGPARSAAPIAPRLVESLSAYDQPFRATLAQLHAPGLNGDSAAAATLRQVVNQAYLLSSVDLFWLSGWIALLLVPLCWIARRPAGGAVTAVAA